MIFLSLYIVSNQQESNHSKLQIVPFAKVNGAIISKDTYDLRLKHREYYFQKKGQNNADLKTMQQNLTDSLINESIISRYAKENNINVSVSDINTLYLQKVQAFNKHNQIKSMDDTQMLNELFNLYGSNKIDYLDTLKMDLLKEKVQSSVGMPLAAWLLEQRKTASIQIY